MAESESSGSSSSVFSLNSLLTVITLVGGVILVSHRLSSDRPQKGPTAGTKPLGLQNIESRLWEDPFAAWDKLTTDDQAIRTNSGLANLAQALTESLSLDSASNRLVLGVMVSGQPYAEDRESRIRTRYAVGAALGAGGYKPAEAEHIGLGTCPWPNSEELERWRTNTNAALGFSNQRSAANSSKVWASIEDKFLLKVPFEIYEAREFFPGREFPSMQTATQQFGRVLVLWLDEDYFGDHPAARLALFLNEVALRIPTNQAVKSAIIGPRYSDTLRALVSPDELPPPGRQLRTDITATLKSVRLILATPTAMDAVLVRTNGLVGVDCSKARHAVAATLARRGLFESVTNFAATDDQMAKEALDELKQRRIDPVNNAHDHLVLISEWDSFFSRMASLALAGEISGRMNTNQSSFGFIEQVRGGTNSWPTNLHRYVYLRGLDGEAAESEDGHERTAKEASDRQRPTSIEEIRKWTPDANKAEGPAQFDYLARLGDRIEALDRDLWRQEGGRVSAVGINGSDVYDTLLILQALRPLLPDAVFFTSDLDARFWDLRELGWTRNLLVFSGYGLQLTNDLQAGVAPFRESAQCAEFLATLSAIGDGRINVLDEVPPRRFEIGRYGPVDLSVTSGDWVHPSPRSVPSRVWLPVVFVIGIPLAVGLLVWTTHRKGNWPFVRNGDEPLAVAPEDFGERAEIHLILRHLDDLVQAGDPLARWLASPRDSTEPSLRLAWEHRLKILIDKCNGMVLMTDRQLLPDEMALEMTQLLGEEPRAALKANRTKAWRNEQLSPAEVRTNRERINYILNNLSGKAPNEHTAVAEARRASFQAHESCQQSLPLFWAACGFCLVLVGPGVGLALRDTYHEPTGEPFNFVGMSAWPAEFIRAAVLALSAIVTVRTQRKLTRGFLEITRRYRLSLQPRSNGPRGWDLFPAEPPLPEAEVKANELWTDYSRARDWRARSWRVIVCVGVYSLFATALTVLAGLPFSPLRGQVLLAIDRPLLACSVLAFLFVTFWMIDTALLCAWFIRRLSKATTRYPGATCRHFAQERAIEDDSLLEDWIDLHLIADLTEPIGRLVYWPFVAVLLLLVARNPWWDHWTWHWPLLVIFGINLVLAGSGSVILQRAALKARELGLKNLKNRVNQKKRKAAASVAEHEADQAELLLAELKNLRRGAFAPLSQNPLIGALLVNSSGAVVVELLATLFSK